MSYPIGARALVEGDRNGIIRYFGPVSGKNGDYVGIELDEKKGRNDGSCGGYNASVHNCRKYYFRCKDGHGLFIKPERVAVYPQSPTEANAGIAAPEVIGFAKIASGTTGKPGTEFQKENTARLGADIERRATSLTDRLQRAAKRPEPPSKLHSITDLPPMETPFKQISSENHVQQKSTLRPGHRMIAVAEPPLSVIRQPDEFRAEIRKLHEDKLALLDQIHDLTMKLAQYERNESADKIVSKAELEQQLMKLQRQLDEKIAMADILHRQNESLTVELATQKSSHIDEVSKLRVFLEELKAQRPAQQSNMVGKRDIGIDVTNRTWEARFVESLHAQNLSLQKKVEELQNTASDRSCQVDLIRSDLSLKIDRLQVDIATLKRRETELMHINDLLRDEAQSARKEDNMKLDAQCKVYKRELDKLQYELAQAQQSLKSAFSTKSELEARHRTALIERDQLILELESRLTAQDNELCELKAILESQDQHSLTTHMPTTEILGNLHSLQSSYQKLLVFYESLKEAKKKEETYFMNLLQDTKNRAIQLAANANNSAKINELERKLVEYREKMTRMNQTLVSSMQAMDKAEEKFLELEKAKDENRLLQEELAEVRRLQTVRLSTSYTDKVKQNKPTCYKFDKQEELPSDKRQNSPAKNATSPVSASLCTVNEADHISKRLQRLKASFSLLGARRLLEEASRTEIWLKKAHL